MKKKSWMAVVLCLVLALSIGALAACGGKDDDKNPPATTPAKLTDGYYAAQMDATHKLLVKFYEDNTFYAEAGDGNAYKGVYETKADISITYANFASDGTIITADSADGKAEWITKTTKVVYFYLPDGKTPFEINTIASSADATVAASKCGYAFGTAKNAVAVVDDMLVNVTLGSTMKATRAMSHSSEVDFDEGDEKAIEKYKFMLADVGDAPVGADAPKVQDYTLILTQKSFESTLLGGDKVLGSFKIKDGAYKLTDDIAGVGYGTVTVNETTKTAVYKSEDNSKTINLVLYEEATFGILTGTANVSFGGQNVNVPFTAKLFDGGLLTVSASTNKFEGTWVYDGKKLTLAAEGLTFSDVTVSGELAASATIAGSLNGTNFTVTVTGDLDEDITISADPVFTMSGTAVTPPTMGSMNVRFDVTVLDNETYSVELFLKMGGAFTSRGICDMGTYTVTGGTYAFTSTMEDAKKGTLTATVDGRTVTGTWSGKMQGSSGLVPFDDVAMTGELSAKEVIKFSGTLFTGVTAEIIFYDDDTWYLGGMSKTLDHGTYTKVGSPVPTFTCVCAQADATLTVTLDATSRAFKAVWHGKVSEQQPAADFNFTQVKE